MYESGFDRDFRRGQEGELLLDELRGGWNGGTVEVKTDYRAIDTTNVYVENRSQNRGIWVRSGIATTTSLRYMFVLGAETDQETTITVRTERLKILARMAWEQGRKGRQPNGENPTTGILVPTSWLIPRKGMP